MAGAGSAASAASAAGFQGEEEPADHGEKLKDNMWKSWSSWLPDGSEMITSVSIEFINYELSTMNYQLILEDLI